MRSHPVKIAKPTEKEMVTPATHSNKMAVGEKWVQLNEHQVVPESIRRCPCVQNDARHTKALHRVNRSCTSLEKCLTYTQAIQAHTSAHPPLVFHNSSICDDAQAKQDRYDSN